MKKISKKIIATTVLGTMLIYTMPIMAFANEETIYSKLDSRGNSYKTIATTIMDEETTQTEIDKELPVDCEIFYELDGEEILPEELAGKSGKVKITLKYKNKMENEAQINGKQEILYTPFVVVAGTIIQNDNNKNIQITNGKLINDGTKTIAVGIAMPGMQESLDISKEDIDIPDSIEITMDSTDFELNNILTYCSPKVLEEDIDFSNIDELFEKVNDLQDGINKIQDGSIQLQDGVIALENGTSTLKNGSFEYESKSKEFNSAMGQLSSGVSTINSKYDELNNGINTLNASSKTLSQGAKSLSDGAIALSAGIDAVNSGVQNLSVGVNNLKTGASNVKGAISQAKQIADSLGTSGNALKQAPNLQSSIEANNKAISSIQVANSALASQLDIVDENAKASINQVINENNARIQELNNINSDLASSNNSAPVVTNTNTQMVTTLQALLTGADSGMTAILTGVDSLKGGTDALNGGVGQLVNNKSALVEGVKQISKGTDALSAGTETLSAGSNQVKTGLSTLDSSTNKLISANNQLTSAAGTISKGASDLADGSTALLSGTNELVNGVKKFNEDGIRKISNEVNGNVKNVIRRVEKLEDLSNEYNKFASTEEREAVKFISIINSIKNSSKDETEEDVIINNNEINVEKKSEENRK